MGIKKVTYGNSVLLDLTGDTVTASHLEAGYTAHDANGETITGVLIPGGGGANPQVKSVTPYTTPQVVTPDLGYDCLSRVNVAAIAYQTALNAAGGTTVTIGTVAGESETDLYYVDTSDATATETDILAGKTAYARGNKLIGLMPDNGAVVGNIVDLTNRVTISAGYHNGEGSVGIDDTERAKIIPENIKGGISILGVMGTLNNSALTKLTPNGTDITYHYLPASSTNPSVTITWENKVNTRSDEYIIEAGKTYLARYLEPYGKRCQTAISNRSLIGNTANIGGCSRIAPDKYHGDIYFTSPINGYLIMYKDDTTTDGFQTECYEVSYGS